MEVKLLPPGEHNTQRMLEGCKYYNLKAKYNKHTAPYVYVEVNTEDDIVNVYWLGMNLSQPKIETGTVKSKF